MVMKLQQQEKQPYYGSCNDTGRSNNNDSNEDIGLPKLMRANNNCAINYIVSSNNNELQQLIPHNKDKSNNNNHSTLRDRYYDYGKNRTIFLVRLFLVTIVLAALFLLITTATTSSSTVVSNNDIQLMTASFDPTLKTSIRISSKNNNIDSSSDSDHIVDNESNQSKKIPWTHIDRSTYDDPITNFMDPTLFHDSLLSDSNSHTTPTSTTSPVFQFPYPTGSFWTNLVLPATAEDNSLSYPIVVYPYSYKWSTKQVIVSYPNIHRIVNTKSIHDYYIPDLIFGTLQSMQSLSDYILTSIQSIDPPNPNIPSSITDRKIMSFDPLSITLRYYCDSTIDSSSRSSSSTTSKKERNEKEILDGNSYWDMYLVQGSPYVTMKYQNVVPYIKAYTTFTNIACPPGIGSIDCVVVDDGSSNSSNTNDESSESKLHHAITLRGKQFVIETREGSRWMMFTSDNVSIQMNLNLRNIISITTPSDESSDTYTGVVRYAILPPSPDPIVIDQVTTPVATTTQSPVDPQQDGTNTALNHLMNTTGVQRLIHHASVYPISCSVDWKFRNAALASTSPTSSSIDTIRTVITGIFHYLFGPKESETNFNDTYQKSAAVRSESSNGRIGTIEFQFQTESFSSNKATDPSELLMLALPHHMEGLVIDDKLKLSRSMFDLVYQCIKGQMNPILGTKWSIDVPLLSLGLDGDSGSNDDRVYLSSPVVRTQILQSLQEDVKLNIPSSNEDIYGFGKQAARLAQLVHISYLYIVGDNSTSDSIASTVHEEGSAALRKALAGLLSSKVSDYLVYDANFGGMVSSNGLTDSHADFGNGRYNDHHFHYGYLLYACAIMGKVDPTFVEEYGDYIDSVFYDIANFNHFTSEKSTGSFFPGARHKIWYDGHSYASGMFPFGNGKSQESSSEAVNGYYGAYLWSVVRNGAANDPTSDISYQTDFARLLLATEIQGAKQYWHMTPPSNSTMTTAAPVYPPDFAANYMVGNIGMLDALCSTWFGNEELYVHMINLIPVTSATGELFRSTYIEQEYTNVLKPLGDVEMAWRGYVVSDHAIASPNAAWNEAEQLVSSHLDTALSKTQVLYWIATRKGFDESAIYTNVRPTDNATPTRGNSSSSKNAVCSSFPSCSRLGLVGDCCPTVQGAFLECCQQR